MNEKVLVEVRLPAADVSYDMYIPLGMPANKILILIQKLLENLKIDGYNFQNDTHMYCENNKQLLLGDKTFLDYAVKDGYRIYIL